jgi:hypothetical protein
MFKTKYNVKAALYIFDVFMQISKFIYKQEIKQKSHQIHFSNTVVISVEFKTM